ncbi:helicase domino-like isoform X1 [Rhagoletis pomonella]|uniref:helicase domino-like isoform X1 n=1 Tax=Rhagoletis pomonella TaxID=28610 RepID=UPI001782C3A6|nr:helicase domino-like isoform X1 [Rhagoletis pomonella]
MKVSQQEGGHQRASPAPPAVSDHRSILSSTTSTASVDTITGYSGTSIPATFTVATPDSFQVIATTFVDSPITPRSFQQAFTQQHLPKQLQQNSPNRISTTNIQSPLNKPLQQKFQYQGAQAQQLPMPQTTRLAETTNTAATDIVSEAQNQIDTKSGIQITTRVLATDTSGSLVNSFPSSTSTTSLIAEAGQQDSPLAKRPKLGGSIGSSLTASLLPTSGSTQDNSNTALSAPEDINALKKRILEQKYLRLRSLKERHTENVAELFYLQSGGNMMDYPTWRKKPPTPQFVTFSNAYRLDQLVNEDRAAALVQQQQQQKATDNIATIIGVASTNQGTQQQQQQHTQQSQKQTQDYLAEIINKTSSQSQIATDISNSSGSNSNSSCSGTSSGVAQSLGNTPTVTATATTLTPGSGGGGNLTTTDASGEALPQGAEIKIPAVGATPVAVSTKLPAAVVQLTQQGMWRVQLKNLFSQLKFFVSNISFEFLIKAKRLKIKLKHIKLSLPLSLSRPCTHNKAFSPLIKFILSRVVTFV